MVRLHSISHIAAGGLSSDVLFVPPAQGGDGEDDEDGEDGEDGESAESSEDSTSGEEDESQGAGAEVISDDDEVREVHPSPQTPHRGQKSQRRQLVRAAEMHLIAYLFKEGNGV